MARKRLACLGSKHRYTFTAKYKRCGYKTYRNHYSPTLLLTGVKYNDRVVTDHLWFNYTKGFQCLGVLQKGDVVKFSARLRGYRKGYGPYYLKSYDYQLSYPTKISLVSHRHPFVPLPVGQVLAMVGYTMQKNRAFYLNNDRPYSRFIKFGGEKTRFFRTEMNRL